jgi:hypothetical protein
MVENLPLIGFLVGMTGTLIGWLRWHLGLLRVTNEVKSAVATDGHEWKFWGNFEEQWNYVFNPGTFIRPTDSGPVTEGKLRLLAYRKKMWRILFTCWAIMVLCPLAGIAGMLLFASHRH